MTETAKPAPRPRRFPRLVLRDTPLNARERRFVDEYLGDLKGEPAAMVVSVNWWKSVSASSTGM